MSLGERLALTLLAIVFAWFVFSGIEKVINGSVNQTAEQIRKVER